MVICSSSNLTISSSFANLSNNTSLNFANSSTLEIKSFLCPNNSPFNSSTKLNVSLSCINCIPVTEGGGGDDSGNGKSPPGGGGGGDDDSGDDKGEGGEEEEFGPLLNFEQIMKEIEKHGGGIKLPQDMLDAAKTVGIRALLLRECLAFRCCNEVLFNAT
ncbi:hypothetical protein ACHQM5_010806 [Ranunculus cassubicifolius]